MLNNNIKDLSKSASFETIIPNILSILPSENQKEISDYLESLNEMQQKAMLIAFEHLGTSFNIIKSNGFKEWKEKND
jgi:hypothetical protein